MGDTRVRDALLVALTVSSGAVDAISWLGLEKVFSAFMTGNIVFLALRTAGAAGPSAPRVVSSLAAFAIGAVLAAQIVAPRTPPAPTWPRRVTIAIGAALLAQASFVGLWMATNAHPSDGAGDALIAMSALAMGMQTTAIFALGVRAVFTTAATATWAVLMGDLSGWTQSKGERWRLASVIAGLFAGGVIGAMLVVHARTWAPVFPLAASALVVTAAALAFRGGRLPAGVAPAAATQPAQRAPLQSRGRGPGESATE